MIKPLVVLGATGSIGRQTVEVAQSLGAPIHILASKNPSSAMVSLGNSHPEARLVVAGGSRSERAEFRKAVANDVAFGVDAVVEAAMAPGCTVVNGIVGAAGFRATVAALEAGNRLALANKESMVAGGPVVLAALTDGGGELIPVDSEHSALYQCMIGESAESVRALILTASGGPFRGRSRSSLEDVTREQALAHPTWDMGPRITIDSATMFNKGLEVIEAHFLFGIPYESIEVVVHPQSLVHSVVEFVDGSLKAHIGHPDMRIPIQYALTAPVRSQGVAKERFSLVDVEMTFEKPDPDAFPALDICYEAGAMGGSAPAIVNAADEIAVEAFLAGRLGFLGIPDLVRRTLTEVGVSDLATIEDVLEADRNGREVAASLVAGAC